MRICIGQQVIKKAKKKLFQKGPRDCNWKLDQVHLARLDLVIHDAMLKVPKITRKKQKFPESARNFIELQESNRNCQKSTRRYQTVPENKEVPECNRKYQNVPESTKNY